MNKRTTVASRIFGLAGALLAFGAAVICLKAEQIPPVLLFPSDGPAQCAREMLEQLREGDYAGASQYLYGTPSIAVTPEDDAGRAIWNAFTASLDCTPVGSCYATADGVAQDVLFSSLQIPDAVRDLKQQAQTLLARQVAQAESMDAVYGPDQQYRPELVAQVLDEALRQTVAASRRRTQRLTLHLLAQEDQWWVLPEPALMNAISGGILE